MRALGFLFLAVIVLVAMSGCAAGPNELAKQPDDDGKVAGFWRGLWHGFIAPIAFVVSLFSKSVNVYETHNNGGWYNLGFLLGASMIFGGFGGGAAKRRRR